MWESLSEVNNPVGPLQAWYRTGTASGIRGAKKGAQADYEDILSLEVSAFCERGLGGGGVKHHCLGACLMCIKAFCQSESLQPIGVKLSSALDVQQMDGMKQYLLPAARSNPPSPSEPPPPSICRLFPSNPSTLCTCAIGRACK